MDWKKELKNNITNVEQLDQYIDLTEQEKRDIGEIIKKFPMSITRHYMSLIQKENSQDPLRKLVIPSGIEFDSEGVLDTSGECENTKLQGLQHKYGPTALMLSTNACACYCRFCFRKRMVGLTNDEIAKHVDEVAEYLKKHPEIDNILISGGDSLLNDNVIIRRILTHLEKIKSIKYVRFGSRMLAVLPQRLMDPELLSIFHEFSKPIYIITHFDHPREISEETIEAIEILKRSGVGLKNQTVLMRGINDKPEIMVELMNRLVECGISSYYVFQCRPVLGVKKQFQVPFIEGSKIIDETRRRLSGPAKQFRYILSHVTGKIEIIGMIDKDRMLFKYHQAKNEKDNARIFVVNISGEKTWLTEEEVKNIEGVI